MITGIKYNRTISWEVSADEFSTTWTRSPSKGPFWYRVLPLEQLRLLQSIPSGKSSPRSKANLHVETLWEAA